VTRKPLYENEDYQWLRGISQVVSKIFSLQAFTPTKTPSSTKAAKLFFQPVQLLIKKYFNKQAKFLTHLSVFINPIIPGLYFVPSSFDILVVNRIENEIISCFYVKMNKI